jgi:hypothetical protein
MNKAISKSVISMLVSGCLLAVTAAPPYIGVIKSPGEFRVDGSTIRGNGSVFDGNQIETTSARSVIALTGVEITLSPESRAQIFRDRTVLEHGTGVVRDADKHVIEAASLRIAPAGKDTVLQVEMSGPNHVVVSSRNGSADVRNAGGVLVASLRTGMSLAFDPQATVPSAVKMTGILQSKGGSFLLTDATSNVTIEVRGANLAKFVGKKVEITGSILSNATATAGASQVVQVAEIKVAGSKTAAKAAGAGAAGAAGGAAAGAGAGAAAGISVAATAAIVGGVAVGGVVTGLAAAGTFSSSSSASRQ